MGHPFKPMLTVLLGLCALTDPAHAVDRFKVTGVDCEAFFLWKHEPVLHFDIVDERRADYERNPAADYFAQAAERTAAYCDRTSNLTQQPLGPPRKIRGVWFQSNDEQVRMLYNFDQRGVDLSAGVVNAIGDRYAADQRAAAQAEEARASAARARQVREAEQRAQQERVAAEQRLQQDRAAAEAARESAFFARTDLQVARLGAPVTPANLTDDVALRTNPFHFRRLGIAVVRTVFTKMVSDTVAEFGNDLAPLFVTMREEDVDRFTHPGETVMLALRVGERGQVERTYGTLSEAIASALQKDPIYGEYVGSYSCPGGDCNHLFDASPPT